MHLGSRKQTQIAKKPEHWQCLLLFQHDRVVKRLAISSQSKWLKVKYLVLGRGSLFTKMSFTSFFFINTRLKCYADKKQMLFTLLWKIKYFCSSLTVFFYFFTKHHQHQLCVKVNCINVLRDEVHNCKIPPDRTKTPKCRELNEINKGC